MKFTSFRPRVPQAALDDLNDRLDRIRWPAAVPETSWERGVPVEYLRWLVDRWRHDYDWRTWEARLAAWPQFITEVFGQRLHFLHARSPEPQALPLVVCHGWPSSIIEFLDILGPLTDPRSHGGDPADAFHVVAPSLPGFGFSTPLSGPGWDHQRIAEAWADIMRRLGYDRYGAHGGDTGSIVSPELGRLVPDHVVGVHICGALAFPDLQPGDLEDLTPTERDRVAAAERLREVGTGYADLQSTRPATVGFALNDSPVGQLAWIVEKFWEWTDPARRLPHEAVDLGHLLTDATLYWLTGTGASSAHLYYEVRAAGRDTPPPRSPVPTGVAVFPTDPTLRRVAAREHHLVHFAEFERGGHFAALETPELLVDDLRRFFRPLR